MTAHTNATEEFIDFFKRKRSSLRESIVCKNSYNFSAKGLMTTYRKMKGKGVIYIPTVIDGYRIVLNEHCI